MQEKGMMIWRADNNAPHQRIWLVLDISSKAQISRALGCNTVWFDDTNACVGYPMGQEDLAVRQLLI
ncbi:hypothetical protein GQ55_3G186800 [Panicum hallii var. hallii]|uniref:Uncharacterized protein n=1 Tax=Panicum hallii var. hallii TaxID=1504633 RepID=A0A2T7EAY1_9POAL|nr:hypothetical protein GQ55_3G186800 [Panicum hallii var. hallii]